MLPNQQRLGRYIVSAEIGAGGMGIVYEAYDPDTGRQVAIKTLPRLDAATLYRFKREFRALADVHHPNLVQLYELVSDGARWFYTMELVRGVDFLLWARGGDVYGDGRDAAVVPVKERHERIRHGAHQLALAIAAVHRAGKVHRDIKPSNILVTDEGRVVLLDFGLVGDRPGGVSQSDTLTVGTVSHMAPEQAGSGRVGPAADWYSMGVILYEALTGHSPFAGSPLQILMEKQRTEPLAPRSVAPEVPADLDGLCTDLLRRSPASRPAAEDVIARLGGGPLRVTKTQSVVGAPLFIGRETELATLLSEVEWARTRGTVAFVRGEPGIGRTSLISQLVERLRRDQPETVVLTGRCYERESVPYKAFDGLIDSLSNYLKRRERDGVIDRLPADAALLARLFPVLGRVPAVARLGELRMTAISPHQLRARAFATLRSVLARIARVRSLVMVIDDFQWADADSFALLAELMQGPDAPRLLLVVTVRTKPHGKLPAAIAKATDSVEHATHLQLEKLPFADAAQLATELYRRVAGSELQDAPAVAEAAECHPLFIDELVRHMVSEHGIAPDVDRLDDALWARICDIDAMARRLLEVIAIAGVPLDPSVAARAAELSSDEAAQWTALLRVANLIRASWQGEHEQLEPYNDRVREAVLRRIDDPARSEHHRRLAEALQVTGAAHEDPQSLIRHLVMADQSMQAASQADQAACRAMKAFAFQRAAELFRVALQLGEFDEGRTREIHLQLAEALSGAGHGAEAADVYQAAARGADAATRLECQCRAAEQLLVTGYIERGFDALSSVLGEIDVELPRTPRRALVSLLWNRLRLRVRGTRFRLRDASEVSPRELTKLDVLHTVAASASTVDNIVGADFQARSMLAALRLGEPKRIARAMSMGAMVMGSQGALARADALASTAEQLAKDIGDPVMEAWAIAARGMSSHFIGEYDVATRLLHDAAARFGELAAGTFELNVMRIFRLIDLRLLGRCRQLRSEYDEYLRDAQRRGDRYMETTLSRALNIVWLIEDDPARARQELANKAWTPPKTGFHIQHWYKLRARGEMALYAGNAARTREQLATSMERLEKSMLLRVKMIRSDYRWLVGRLALFECAAGQPQAPRHALVAKQAGRLARDGSGLGTLWCHLLRAGIAHQSGDDAAAAEILARSVDVAHEGGFLLYEAAARQRRGQLLGGSHGSDLIAEGHRIMAREQVKNPARMTAMIAPGFGVPGDGAALITQE